MGLSTKQVSSDGYDWNQALLQASTLELPKPELKKHSLSQQQGEQLKCPRCDSTNTKFCYYNNYNKSQPRHFCKACKRHWTKGGTLRNVPVGGGRKNKRKVPKTTSKTNHPTTTTTATTTTSSGLTNNNMIAAFYPTTTLSIPHNTQELQFPYSNLASFESNPCSISSIHSSNLYNYTGEVNALEETVMNSSNSMSDHHFSWSMPNTTSNVMDMSSNWGWDDFDKFVSVEADLTIPWDDTEIKPSCP